jgi:hypothetical protein
MGLPIAPAVLTLQALTVLLSVLRQPDSEQPIPQVQLPIEGSIDFNNPEELFATKLNEALSSAWSNIEKHITKYQNVKNILGTIRKYGTSGNVLSLAGVVASCTALRRVGQAVIQLGAYNKTFATEADKFNTNFNSSATKFVEVVENKTAAFESIARNVTAMVDNKAEMFLNTTASFLTEFKVFNSKLDMFNSTISFRLDMFNGILAVMTLIVFVDRVSEHESASLSLAQYQA